MANGHNSDYETISTYGQLNVKVVKTRNIKSGYTSYHVEKRYRQNREIHSTGFLRSVSELEELLAAVEEALAAESGATPGTETKSEEPKGDTKPSWA